MRTVERKEVYIHPVRRRARSAHDPLLPIPVFNNTIITLILLLPNLVGNSAIMISRIQSSPNSQQCSVMFESLYLIIYVYSIY